MIKEMNLNLYRSLLIQIRDHLSMFIDKRWPPRLEEWIKDIECFKEKGFSNSVALNHLQRTRKALGGMGSLGDIVICPEAGHLIEKREDVIAAANNHLLKLVKLLDGEITRLLNDISEKGTSPSLTA